MSKSTGRLICSIVFLCITLLFVFMTGMYTLVWIKLRTVVRVVANPRGGGCKYSKSARVMMLFVGSFLVQWWFPGVYTAVWYFTKPATWIYVGMVVVTNTSAIANFVVLRMMTKKYAVKDKGDRVVEPKNLNSALPEVKT